MKRFPEFYGISNQKFYQKSQRKEKKKEESEERTRWRQGRSVNGKSRATLTSRRLSKTEGQCAGTDLLVTAR
jgi:hypothetical protein